MRSRWGDQFVAGRVFELRNTSKRLVAPCILILDPGADYRGRSAIEINENGVYDVGYRPSNVRWVDCYSWRREDMTPRKIARRRRDLERYDARDIELILYGLRLEFGGRVWGGQTRAHIPCFPGRWSIFWTKSAAWGFGPESRARERELRELLGGAWWIESWCGGDWRFGRDSRLHGWATLHESPSRLRAIEHLLRTMHVHLDRCEVEIVTVREGDREITFGRGHVGPAFYFPATYTRRGEGYSISVRSEAA
jgi:hypothetical protein